MATAFRYYSVYETGVCFAIVLAGAFPEWLDRLAQRAERIRFMRKEEKRLAQHRDRKNSNKKPTLRNIPKPLSSPS